MVEKVGNRDEYSAQQPPETLQLGPSRSSLLQKLPAPWRQYAAASLAFVLGVVAGGGAMLWWQSPPAPPPSGERADQQPRWFDEHAVELILLEPAAPRTPPSGSKSEASLLHVHSAFLLSGAMTSTVLSIDSPDQSLDVRVPALPVTVSPTTRYQLVDLELIFRDCKAATRWAPVDRPFTISWQDEFGREHVDTAGDLDRSTAASLIRYIDAGCDHQ
jgi:hypothetical protein